MSFVAAKCTSCGAPIQVDDTLKHGVCPYCKTEFVTQDVIQNITINNTTNLTNNTTNNIQSAVFYQGGDAIETLYERFQAYLKLSDRGSAESTAKEMAEKYPHKAVSWYCLAFLNLTSANKAIKRDIQDIMALPSKMNLPDPQKYFLIDSNKKLPDTVDAFRQTQEDLFNKIVTYDTNSVKRPYRINTHKFYISEAEIELENAQKIMTSADKDTYNTIIWQIDQLQNEYKISIKNFNESIAATVKEIEAKRTTWKQAARQHMQANIPEFEAYLKKKNVKFETLKKRENHEKKVKKTKKTVYITIGVLVGIAVVAFVGWFAVNLLMKMFGPSG